MTRLILYNIEYCEGIKGHWWEYLKLWRIFFPPKNLDKKIVSELKKLNPDILALVEVDTGSFRSKKDEVVFFEKELDMKSFVEMIKYPLRGWLKFFHYIPILRFQANAILAKDKLTDMKYHVLHEGTKRVVIEAKLNKKVTLLLAHLALGKKARTKQIAELIKIVNKIHTQVILMGDFNTYKGEAEIKDLLKKTNLHHMYQLGDDITFTQPSFSPKRRLDYVLTSDKIHVKKYKVLDYKFSDHLPILVDFEIE